MKLNLQKQTIPKIKNKLEQMSLPVCQIVGSHTENYSKEEKDFETQ